MWHMSHVSRDTNIKWPLIGDRKSGRFPPSWVTYGFSQQATTILQDQTALADNRTTQKAPTVTVMNIHDTVYTAYSSERHY